MNHVSLGSTLSLLFVVLTGYVGESVMHPHPPYMFFPQNAGTECATQEEAHPVSSTTTDVGLPVVMTTSEVVTGLAAAEGAKVAHSDNGDGMAVDPVVVPAGERGGFHPVACEGEGAVVSVTYS